jgi:hypothetical protein
MGASIWTPPRRLVELLLSHGAEIQQCPGVIQSALGSAPSAVPALLAAGAVIPEGPVFTWWAQGAQMWMSWRAEDYPVDIISAAAQALLNAGADPDAVDPSTGLDVATMMRQESPGDDEWTWLSGWWASWRARNVLQDGLGGGDGSRPSAARARL